MISNRNTQKWKEKRRSSNWKYGGRNGWLDTNTREVMYIIFDIFNSLNCVTILNPGHQLPVYQHPQGYPKGKFIEFFSML